ncbi:hypothetical protein HanPI659440_Chr12g0450131 [Helianthus annuus]|nr:hypothetical protein HanPI659440_Chr12g0450131 [Helianthus annuus]
MLLEVVVDWVWVVLEFIPTTMLKTAAITRIKAKNAKNNVFLLPEFGTRAMRGSIIALGFGGRTQVDLWGYLLLTSEL